MFAGASHFTIKESTFTVYEAGSLQKAANTAAPAGSILSAVLRVYIC